MKKTYVFELNLLHIVGAMLFLFVSNSTFAQSVTEGVPQGINYQAIARDIDGKPIREKVLSVRLTVWDDSTLLANQLPAGNAFEQISNVKTNRYGLFTLVIGADDITDFQNIPWGSGVIKYLQVDIDTTGTGGGWIEMKPRSPLMSVPYALYAQNANHTIKADTALYSQGSADAWKLTGNALPDTTQFIGTTNLQPLAIKTNGVERILIRSNGFVGINEHTPLGMLQVRGNGVDSTGYGFGVMNDTGHVSIAVRNDGLIGMGTIFPQTKLDVRGKVKIADGTEGLGKVLTSDATGIASWQPIADTDTGTVVDFSADNLLPLFTTTVTNDSVHPHLQFQLANAPAFSVLGNSTSNTTAPAYVNQLLLTSPLFQSQGTTDVVLHGNNNGALTWGKINLSTEVYGTLPMANMAIDTNTATQAGIVAAGGSSKPNLVWKTDAAGNPGWRVDSAGVTYKPGTGVVISGDTINSVWTQQGNHIFNNNNNGNGNVGIGVTNPITRLHVSTSANSGGAGRFLITSTTNNSNALNVETAGNGDAGNFVVTKTNNQNSAVYAETKSTDVNASAGHFYVSDGSALGDAIYAENDGNGTAIWAENFGNGDAGYFGTGATDTSSSAIYAENYGEGYGGLFYTSSTNTNVAAIYGENIGEGPGGEFFTATLDSAVAAVHGENWGNGIGGKFITNSFNAIPAVYGLNNGDGDGGWFVTKSNKPYSSAVYGANAGSGFGGVFLTKSSQPSVSAISAQNEGAGNAGQFRVTDPNNTNSAVNILTVGKNAPALYVGHTGATTGSIDYGIVVDNTGVGAVNIGAFFRASGATDNYSAIFGKGKVQIGNPTEETGELVFANITNDNGVSIKAGITTTAYALTLPTSLTNNAVLTHTTGGVLTWGTASSIGAWSTTGNAGTTPGTHFIGTTDNKDFIVRTNNVDRLKIYADGKARFGPHFSPSALGYLHLSYSDATQIIPGLLVSNTNTNNLATTAISLINSSNDANKGGGITLNSSSYPTPRFQNSLIVGTYGPYLLQLMTNKKSRVVIDTISTGGVVGIATQYAPLIIDYDTLGTSSYPGLLIKNKSAASTAFSSVVLLNDLNSPKFSGGIYMNSSTNSTSSGYNGMNIGTNGPAKLQLGTNGIPIITIDTAGNVGVGTDTSSLTLNARLTIKEGHLKHIQTLPPSKGSINTDATGLTRATDVAGNFSFTPDASGAASGGTLTITFNKAYAVPPIVVISPTNSKAAVDIAKVWVTSSTTNFVVNFDAGCSTNPHTFNYHVIETQN